MIHKTLAQTPSHRRRVINYEVQTLRQMCIHLRIYHHPLLLNHQGLQVSHQEQQQKYPHLHNKIHVFDDDQLLNLFLLCLHVLYHFLPRYVNQND